MKITKGKEPFQLISTKNYVTEERRSTSKIYDDPEKMHFSSRKYAVLRKFVNPFTTVSDYIPSIIVTPSAIESNISDTTSPNTVVFKNNRISSNKAEFMQTSKSIAFTEEGIKVKFSNLALTATSANKISINILPNSNGYSTDELLRRNGSESFTEAYFSSKIATARVKDIPTTFGAINNRHPYENTSAKVSTFPESAYNIPENYSSDLLFSLASALILCIFLISIFYYVLKNPKKSRKFWSSTKSRKLVDYTGARKPAIMSYEKNSQSYHFHSTFCQPRLPITVPSDFILESNKGRVNLGYLANSKSEVTRTSTELVYPNHTSGEDELMCNNELATNIRKSLILERFNTSSEC